MAREQVRPVDLMLATLTQPRDNSNLISVVHLDVEEWSEELLRQLSYAIKNQLGHPKPPTRGFGTQRPNG